MIVVACGLEIGRGGLGFPGHAEGLAQSEERVSVVRVGGQRRAVVGDRGGIALCHRQPSAQPG